MEIIQVGDKVVKIGEAGRVTFREPDNREWSQFQANRYPTRGRKIRDNSFAARVEFFDLLFKDVENIGVQSNGTPVLLTAENCKELLPARQKAAWIFKAFEEEEIDSELERD